MIISLLPFALALEPEVNVHGTLGVGGDPDTIPVAVGGGALVGFPLATRLHLEVGGDYALMRERGRFADATAGARYFLGDPLNQAFSVFAHGGIGLENVTTPVGLGGLAVDLERGARVRPRIALGYLFAANDTDRVLLQVGAVLGRQVPPPPVVAPTVDLPIESYQSGTVKSREPGMLWVPDPVCTWLPIDEANARIASLDLAIQEPSVVSSRLLRAPEAPLEPVLLPTIDAGPRPGKVVVVTSDYDHVVVGDDEVVVDGGIGIGSPGGGMQWVQVVGGGRQLKVPVFAVEENAIWLPVDPPGSHRVGFSVGSASLRPDTLGIVGRLAELRGDWSYHIRGSYSIEGDRDTNIRLALLRAGSIQQALYDAGVPEGAVVILEPVEPDPNATPEDQRAATIVPVEVP